MIKINNLSKDFIENKIPFKVLDNISVQFNKGERVAIIGPSGSGKSTLLRCINRLETPTSGNIMFNGIDINSSKSDINKIRQKIGMVFQHFNLFPHLTVMENIILAPTTLKIIEHNEAIILSRQLLKTVGLENKENTYPRYLSGGQKQRIAIVRAIIMNPELMLFDEPTSALDPEKIKDVVSVILNTAKKGMTMIFVTHEMNFVKMIATRVIFMDKGNILFDSTPKELFEECKVDRITKFLNQFS